MKLPELNVVAYEIETENNFGGVDKWITSDTKHYMDLCDRGEPLALVTLSDANAAIKAAYYQGKREAVPEFVHAFERHVGGDGEFWLHELEDFAAAPKQEK